MSYGAAIPPPPNGWRPRPILLRWRLRAAWAALHGRSVLLNVGLRADTDALGQGRLSVSVWDGFQVHNVDYAAMAGVSVNGVPLEEVDPTAELFPMGEGPL
jgi:hypothetical protein